MTLTDLECFPRCGDTNACRKAIERRMHSAARGHCGRLADIYLYKRKVRRRRRRMGIRCVKGDAWKEEGKEEGKKCDGIGKKGSKRK